MIFLPLLVIAFWTGSLSQWGSLENTVELVSGGIWTCPLALLWSTFRVLSAFQELPWAWLRHTSQWPVLIIYILQMPFFSMGLWISRMPGNIHLPPAKKCLSYGLHMFKDKVLPVSYNFWGGSKNRLLKLMYSHLKQPSPRPTTGARSHELPGRL